MDTDNANIESYTAAAQLRTAISELFCAYPSANIVLSPGILVGLRILFAHLSVKHVALTTEEYYDPVHFPNMSVEAFALDTFYDHILQLKPDAVIASVVTWQGRILPVAKLFQATAVGVR